MNYLFVCLANKDRSRTAEFHFQKKYPEHRFRSAGINKYLSERHGGIQVRQYMLDVADKIICMEQQHADYILKQISSKYASKISILNLDDHESFMSENLILALEEKFQL